MENSRKALYVKVACIQMDVVLKNKKANLDSALCFMTVAAEQGANLLILPELFNSGYTFDNRDEMSAFAEIIPNGETVNTLSDFAAKRKVYIVASIAEIDGINMYNTAVLIGPDGYIGKYRKTHLFGDDIYWFEPGNLGFPVFSTKIGRIAMLVCLDGFYPETYRLCALQKADIICIPTNWAHCDHLPAPWHTMGPILTMSNALSNHIFVAACTRVGAEPGIRYAGHSVIVGPTGAPVSEIAGQEQQIIYAECDLVETRNQYISATNARLKNRRTDLYDEFLGYDIMNR